MSPVIYEMAHEAATASIPDEKPLIEKKLKK
jgi:hypothetical protein